MILKLTFWNFSCTFMFNHNKTGKWVLFPPYMTFFWQKTAKCVLYLYFTRNYFWEKNVKNVALPNSILTFSGTKFRMILFVVRTRAARSKLLYKRIGYWRKEEKSDVGGRFENTLKFAKKIRIAKWYGKSVNLTSNEKSRKNILNPRYPTYVFQ